MGSPRQGLRTTTSGPGRPGFVLLEFMLALLVLGLAAVLLLTVLGRIRQRIRLDELGTTLQATAAALEKVRTETGRWPATAAEAGPLLPGGAWPEDPAVGGELGWVPPAGAGQPGMITLTAFAPRFPLELTRADLVALDRRLDDGSLAGGRLRTGFNGWPVYLVGEQP